MDGRPLSRILVMKPIARLSVFFSLAFTVRCYEGPIPSLNPLIVAEVDALIVPSECPRHEVSVESEHPLVCLTTRHGACHACSRHDNRLFRHD